MWLQELGFILLLDLHIKKCPMATQKTAITSFYLINKNTTVPMSSSIDPVFLSFSLMVISVLALIALALGIIATALLVNGGLANGLPSNVVLTDATQTVSHKTFDLSSANGFVINPSSIDSLGLLVTTEGGNISLLNTNTALYTTGLLRFSAIPDPLPPTITAFSDCTVALTAGSTNMSGEIQISAPVADNVAFSVTIQFGRFGSQKPLSVLISQSSDLPPTVHIPSVINVYALPATNSTFTFSGTPTITVSGSALIGKWFYFVIGNDF